MSYYYSRRENDFIYVHLKCPALPRSIFPELIKGQYYYQMPLKSGNKLPQASMFLSARTVTEVTITR